MPASRSTPDALEHVLATALASRDSALAAVRHALRTRVGLEIALARRVAADRHVQSCRDAIDASEALAAADCREA